MADTKAAVDAAESELNASIAALNKVTASAGGATTQSTGEPTGWSPQLVCKLSLGVGVFALVSLILVTVLLCKSRSAEQILRTFGILVIIFAAVFLVVSGYSETQITPVIGLLGTIAGYLLGRRIEPPPTADEASLKKGALPEERDK